MSVTVHYNQNDAVEDCRDYLRTGRCKYGASCKFNHPANVQSGGGIKAPIDPLEPLFPVRANEPLCQYYMKHGTCKFGLACKFNHPVQSAISAMISGTSALSQGPQHILLNQISGSDQTSSMMLQILPQRPDEPDCIYFLRNGRCKYGATCRYHHPVNYQQRKPFDHLRRQQMQVQLSSAHVSNDGAVLQGHVIDGHHENVQYVTTTQGNHNGYSHQRVIQTSSGAHVLVQETPVKVIQVNSNGQQNYRQVNFSQGRDYNEIGVEYETPVGAPLSGGKRLSRERALSSSSLFLSHGPSYDHDQEASGDDNNHWHGSTRRSFSGGNLSSHDQHHQLGQHIHHISNRVASSVNDTTSNFSSRRHRAASLGSTSEHPPYHDALIGTGWSIGGHPQSLPSHLETESWMDNNTKDSSNQVRQSSSRYDGYDQDIRRPYPFDHSRQSQTRRIQISSQLHEKQLRQQVGVDQGLSLMTDALLTMLDTPDDCGSGKMRQSSSFSTVPTVTSPTSTPRSAPVGTIHEPIPLDVGLMSPWTGNHGMYSQEQRATLFFTTSSSSYQSQSMSSHNERNVQHSFLLNSQLSHENAYFSNGSNQYPPHAGVEPNFDSRWSTTLQENPPLGQPFDQNTQGLSILQSRIRGPSSSHSPDIGLYLP